MALICMAVYDTDDNNRSKYTKETLTSLVATVDFHKHELSISDNGSCKKTQEIYEWLQDLWFGNPTNLKIVKNGKNLGTAEAINRVLQHRRPLQHCIKIDNDVVIHNRGWVDEMEITINRSPAIGVLGLKRKDLEQRPDHQNPVYRSELLMVKHEPGQSWIVVEKAKDIMGTCVMLNHKLLDEIGYLYQPRLYGFDDVDCSIRSELAGYVNAFLPHIDIDHIDTGGTDYTKWKTDHAGAQWNEINKLFEEYKSGERSLYYNPFKK